MRPIDTIITRTRQFAVRQERWFRRDPRVRWIDVEHDPVAEAVPAVLDALAPNDATMTTITLTKHHGLGNDFLVLFDPRGRPIDLAELARQVCDRRRGIGADGLLVGESADGVRGADDPVQRRRRPGRDERQRHPLLRAGARHRSRRPRRPAASSPTPATALVTLSPPTTPTRSRPASTWARSSRSTNPPAGTTLGCHPDRPVMHLSLGNPHSVVGVDEVARGRPARSRSQVPAHQPRDRRARPGAERRSRCASTNGRRHHRSMRHRRLRLGVRRPVVGARRRRLRGNRGAHGRRECHSRLSTPRDRPRRR